MIELNFPAANPAPSAACCFLFQGDELLLKEDSEQNIIPLMQDIKKLPSPLVHFQYIGTLNQTACYTGSIEAPRLPAGYTPKKLRPLYSELSEDLFGMALRAYHLLTWLKNNQFCGCCGTKMATLSEELAQKCPSCGHIAYPKISPAIIVAITKEDKILLARSNRFPPGRYSVIAGFVEAGENLEQGVIREIKEEVGIQAKNIRYFSSQPWPYPDSLMIGFTAEWAGGEITIDNKEIVAADWFTANTLPDIPGQGSLGRKLIDWYLKK
ncbi:MAG: NAD(+) diphosphatase [Pelosinus sp.]|nr:NAD(+) diphosphatase [Pelosinus sp.]